MATYTINPDNSSKNLIIAQLAIDMCSRITRFTHKHYQITLLSLWLFPEHLSQAMEFDLFPFPPFPLSLSTFNEVDHPTTLNPAPYNLLECRDGCPRCGMTGVHFIVSVVTRVANTLDLRHRIVTVIILTRGLDSRDESSGNL